MVSKTRASSRVHWVGLGICALGWFALAACSPGERSAGADLQGYVMEIQQVVPGAADRDLVGVVLIEADPAAGAAYDRANVRITVRTRFFDYRTRPRTRVTFDALEPGQRVDVQFYGPVMESYPVQATGRVIIIVPDDAAPDDAALEDA